MQLLDVIHAVYVCQHGWPNTGGKPIKVKEMGRGIAECGGGGLPLHLCNGCILCVVGLEGHSRTVSTRRSSSWWPAQNQQQSSDLTDTESQECSCTI